MSCEKFKELSFIGVNPFLTILLLVLNDKNKIEESTFKIALGLSNTITYSALCGTVAYFIFKHCWNPTNMTAGSLAGIVAASVSVLLLSFVLVDAAVRKCSMREKITECFADAFVDQGFFYGPSTAFIATGLGCISDKIVGRD